HTASMREAGQWTKVDVSVLRIAHTNARNALEDCLFESLEPLSRYKNARSVGADLPRAEEIRGDGNLGGPLDLGIRKDNQRRLASELHRHSLQRRAGRSHDFLSGFGAAGER